MTWSDRGEEYQEPRNAPRYDVLLSQLLHHHQDQKLLATCSRAGFVLVRDAAKLTGDELVAKHGFTKREVEALHRAFAGEPKYESPIEHGPAFAHLIELYMRDLSGSESNPVRAWEKLGELGAQPKQRPPHRPHV
ncbi:MAG: hypothetical protein WAZ14_03870 [Patescibacteria group bacterium]